VILPTGHWQAVAAPRRLRPRERWMIASVLGIVAAAVVALVISFASSVQSSGHGCIHVTVEYVTGGTQIDHCGAQARAFCASVGRPGGESGAVGRAVASECRKAGLPASH
jgi:hypothetical protein